MNLSRDAIETSYNFCRGMNRRAGSNFRAGFLLLPREKRRAMEALYAFMRHTDDLADDIKPRPLVAPAERKGRARGMASGTGTFLLGAGNGEEVKGRTVGDAVLPLPLLSSRLADVV